MYDLIMNIRMGRESFNVLGLKLLCYKNERQLLFYHYYSSIVVVVSLTLKCKWLLCYKYLLVGIIFNCKANVSDCIQALFSIDTLLCENKFVLVTKWWVSFTIYRRQAPSLWSLPTTHYCSPNEFTLFLEVIINGQIIVIAYLFSSQFLDQGRRDDVGIATDVYWLQNVGDV